jgi:hypothetical protein
MVWRGSRGDKTTYEFERTSSSGSQAARERALHCLAVRIVGNRQNSLWSGAVRRITASRCLARLRRLHCWIVHTNKLMATFKEQKQDETRHAAWRVFFIRATYPYGVTATCTSSLRITSDRYAASQDSHAFHSLAPPRTTKGRFFATYRMNSRAEGSSWSSSMTVALNSW